MITGEEIDKLAELARLELPSEEKATLQKDLSAILDYVATLKTAPVGDLEAKLPSDENINVMRRDDEINSTAEAGEFVKVKKIL